MGPDYPEPEAFIRRFFPTDAVSRAPHLSPDSSTDMVLGSLGKPHNDCGFRADPLNEGRGALNIVCVGCSNTVGLGVTYEETFAYLLKRRFEDHYGVPVRNWNLGYAGSSIDFATRTLLNALEVLKPDIAFIIFTALDRREYFTGRGRFGRYHISTYHAYKNGQTQVCPEDVAEEMSHFYGLGNVLDDTANAFHNYKIAEAALEASGAIWGWSTVWADETKSLFADLRDRDLVSTERYVGVAFDRLDNVSNPGQSQPGPKSQVWYAGVLWDWLHANYATRLQVIVDRYRAEHGQPNSGITV